MKTILKAVVTLAIWVAILRIRRQAAKEAASFVYGPYAPPPSGGVDVWS